MPRKKLLLLGKTPPPFMGPSIATQILLKSKLKDNFHLIHQETKLNKNLNNIGKLNFSKPFILLQRYIGFTIKCLLHQPDIIIIPISQSWSGFSKDAVFIKIGALFNHKMLIQLRGSNFLTFYNQLSGGKQKYITNTLQKCAGAIVLGQKLRYIFEPFFTSDKIHVVPNGGNYSFNTEAASNFNPQTSTLKLIYLGNLQPSKGILDVIDAFIWLNSKLNIELNIVGKWRDQATKQHVFDKLQASGFKLQTSGFRLQVSGFTKQITFHSVLSGQVKLDLLSKNDIMLFPPREPEGHPWVIVEAMAAGLPIIATNQGAISESVIHNENGFIVDTESPNQIAEKITILMNHPEKCKEMSEKSHMFYLNKYTEDKMTENLTSVINSAIQS